MCRLLFRNFGRWLVGSNRIGDQGCRERRHGRSDAMFWEARSVPYAITPRGRTPPVDLATLKILRRGQTGLWPGFRVPNAVVEHTGGQQEGKAMRAERRAVARQIDNVRDSAPDDARERCRWVRAGIIQEDRESVGSRQRLVAKPGGGGTELQSREPRPTSVRPSHCSRAAEDDLVRFEAMPEPRARPN